MSLYDKYQKVSEEIRELVELRAQAMKEAEELEAQFDPMVATEEDSERLEKAYADVKDLNDRIKALNEDKDRLREKIKLAEEAAKEVVIEEITKPEASDNGLEVTVPGKESVGDAPVRVLEPSAEQIDKDLADYVRCAVLAQGSAYAMPQIARRLGNDRLGAVMDQASNPSVVPPNYTNRIIELLTPRSVVRQLPGLRRIPLNNGNLRIPKMLSGATAAYYGESQPVTLSTPTTGAINLVAKKLMAATVTTGELVRRSDPSADRLILDDLVRAIGLVEDITFIRSNGGGNSPTGMLFLANAANKFAANPANTVVSVTQDLGKAILNLEASDVPLDSAAWIMHPRSKRFIMDLRDGNGNLAFPEMARGELRGYPVFTTSQIPTNLGGGGNESEVYFVAANELILADVPFFSLESSGVAAYDDGGTVKSAFSQDEVVVRAITEHDFNVRHDLAVSVIENVTWA